MQKVSEHFELTRAVEGIRVIGCRPAQIHFLADRSGDTPIVSAIGFSGTILGNSTAPIRGNAPGESLPVSERFESLISVQRRFPSRETVGHWLTPNARHQSSVIVLDETRERENKNRHNAEFHERNCTGAKV